MEPLRLLKTGATDAERALLDSARVDGPPEGAAGRMLVALRGLPAAGGDGGSQAVGDAPAHAGPSTGGSMAAQAIKAGALAKVGLVSLVGLGVLGGGALVHRLAGQSSAPIERSPARALATRAEPVTENAALSGGGESPSPAFATSATPSGGPGRALRHPGASPTARSLGAETRVLDAARAAVDARDPAAAERALDSYDQRFPRGNLRPEATVLRLAVLVQQGQGAAARSLAARLLGQPSYQAYEQRIRSLLREAGER